MNRRWTMIILLVLVLACLVMIRPCQAQGQFTPAQPDSIVDPAHIWLGENPVVTMVCRINKEGRVERVVNNTVSPPLRPLYEWVAKHHWAFHPATLNGRPTRCEMVVQFNYPFQSKLTIVSCAPLE